MARQGYRSDVQSVEMIFAAHLTKSIFNLRRFGYAHWICGKRSVLRRNPGIQVEAPRPETPEYDELLVQYSPPSHIGEHRAVFS
jgi:hypothetical protein